MTAIKCHQRQRQPEKSCQACKDIHDTFNQQEAEAITRSNRSKSSNDRRYSICERAEDE